MARRRKDGSQPDKAPERIPVYDDFLYDDLQESGGQGAFHFPDEQGQARHNRVLREDDIKGLKRKRAARGQTDTEADSAFAPSMEAEEDGASDTPERALSTLQESREEADDDAESGGFVARMKKKRKASGKVMETPEEGEKTPKRARRIGLVIITLAITGVAACMAFFRITGIGLLAQPESFLGRVITPVQSLFSSVTESFAGYLRTLKLRANLETEYNKLRAENEQLVYQAMLAEELQVQLSQYENMYDEVNANLDLNPLVCQVIDRSDTNYFANFVINKGSRDGIADYMAVTISGALVGYTENVKETTSTVRCIIDSEASIAALIESSRDQGTVKGTLGIDGTYMCRMYYLSDDHLPRPGDTVVTSGVGMSFPKGIPIGTVRESTRGMDANKQYIVVEPLVDFEHIEYVIVLRYQPAAEAVTSRESASSYLEFVPLETARPYPTLRIISSNFGTATPAPTDVTPTPSPTPTATPTPSPTPSPTPEPTLAGPVYEYHPVETGPTAVPTATPSPTPTPYITLNPGDMTYEEDE